MHEELPRNSSATSLLSDYGLNFGMQSVAPSTVQVTSSPHRLNVPGLRATSSSPNLGIYNTNSSPPQQVLVEQPPASTLPDLLCPANTLPRHTSKLGASEYPADVISQASDEPIPSAVTDSAPAACGGSRESISGRCCRF